MTPSMTPSMTPPLSSLSSKQRHSQVWVIVHHPQNAPSRKCKLVRWELCLSVPWTCLQVVLREFWRVTSLLDSEVQASDSGCGFELLFREGGRRTAPRQGSARAVSDNVTEASTVRGRRGKLSLDKGWPGEQVQREAEKQQKPRPQRLPQKASFIHPRAFVPRGDSPA